MVLTPLMTFELTHYGVSSVFMCLCIAASVWLYKKTKVYFYKQHVIVNLFNFLWFVGKVTNMVGRQAELDGVVDPGTIAQIRLKWSIVEMGVQVILNLTLLMTTYTILQRLKFFANNLDLDKRIIYVLHGINCVTFCTGIIAHILNSLPFNALPRVFKTLPVIMTLVGIEMEYYCQTFVMEWAFYILVLKLLLDSKPGSLVKGSKFASTADKSQAEKTLPSRKSSVEGGKPAEGGKAVEGGKASRKQSVISVVQFTGTKDSFQKTILALGFVVLFNLSFFLASMITLFNCNSACVDNGSSDFSMTCRLCTVSLYLAPMNAATILVNNQLVQNLMTKKK